MTLDEGYIKYRGNWTAAAPIDADAAALLDRWRRPLHEACLIGHYDEGDVGFGNLSMRADASTFYISGTQTGHLTVTDGRHYAHVTAYDIEQNSVDCTGPVQASSESLTHAAIYELDPGINGIVHVHSMNLWHKLVDKLPATRADVAYGTPEMATEFGRLYRETPFADIGIAAMAGHEAGLVSIGEDLEQATLRILDLAREFA